MTQSTLSYRPPNMGLQGLAVACGRYRGLGTVVIKSTVDTLSPNWLVGMRFMGAGIVLALALLPRLKRLLDADQFLAKGTILGVFLYFSYWCNTWGSPIPRHPTARFSPPCTV